VALKPPPLVLHRNPATSGREARRRRPRRALARPGLLPSGYLRLSPPSAHTPAPPRPPRSWELRLGITVETTENGTAGVKLCKLRYARSALGPCRNGRARAWAVPNGRPRSRGTAGRRPFGLSSLDDADARFRLWSRRSWAQPPSHCYLVGSPPFQIPHVSHGVHLRTRDQT
jgi:hypothetical protein